MLSVRYVRVIAREDHEDLSYYCNMRYFDTVLGYHTNAAIAHMITQPGYTLLAIPLMASFPADLATSIEKLLPPRRYTGGTPHPCHP